ncbi:hypothetical protein [Burkholderia diffusa]|nr:hypothetical protein [Burkholderia diffusa]
MSAVFDTSAARDFERSPVKRALREHAEHPPDRLGLICAIQSVLYGLAPSTCAVNFVDIVSGPNGTCDTLCTTAVGHDYVTGLGRPMAADLIQPLTSGF